MTITRRGLAQSMSAALAWLALPWSKMPVARAQDTVVRSPLLSMSEIRFGERDPAAMVKRRFDLYTSMGCGGLRVGMGWREFEKREGVWERPDPRYLEYFRLAKEDGFRMKVQLGVVSAVPDWFAERYPDSKLLNQRGDSPRGYLSPWYPNASAILAEKQDRVFQMIRDLGALEITDYLIVDLGPAGEPTYPAAWHMGRGYTPETSLFWYFDPHAQAHFGPQMEAKYHGDLNRANATWHTDFRSWGDVRPPVPNTVRGPIWLDLLSWYFDVKRQLITEQIKGAVRLIERYSPGRPIRPLLLMPGDHASQDDFDDTARDGLGTYLAKIGADAEFVVDEAAAHGCWLQYG